MNDKLFKKMKKLNKIEHKSLIEKALKLNEEAGELSAEILKLHGRKGANGKTRPEILFESLLELADIQLMVAAICDDLGYSYDELCAAISQKISKYELNLKKQIEWENNVSDDN